MHSSKPQAASRLRAAPAKVLYSKLPDRSVQIITDKLCVLLGGSLLQLPDELLLLVGILPLRKDLVQANLSRLVQAFSHGWLRWSSIMFQVHLQEEIKSLLWLLACSTISTSFRESRYLSC